MGMRGFAVKQLRMHRWNYMLGCALPQGQENSKIYMLHFASRSCAGRYTPTRYQHQAAAQQRTWQNCSLSAWLLMDTASSRLFASSHDAL